MRPGMMIYEFFVTLALLFVLPICSTTRVLPRGQYSPASSKAYYELRNVIVHPRGEISHGKMPARLQIPAKPLMQHASSPQASAAEVKRTLLGKRQSCSAGYGYCYSTCSIFAVFFKSIVTTDVLISQHLAGAALTTMVAADVAMTVLALLVPRPAVSMVVHAAVERNVASQAARLKEPIAAAMATIANPATSVAETAAARQKVANVAPTQPIPFAQLESYASSSTANKHAVQTSAAVKKSVPAAEDPRAAIRAETPEAEMYQRLFQFQPFRYQTFPFQPLTLQTTSSLPLPFLLSQPFPPPQPQSRPSPSPPSQPNLHLAPS